MEDKARITKKVRAHRFFELVIGVFREQ